MRIAKLEIYSDCFSTQYELSPADKSPANMAIRHAMKGAIYRSDGTLIEETLRPSSGGDQVQHLANATESAPTAASVLRGRSVFAGHFMAHYGHFITEGISRLWLNDFSKFSNVVFFPFLFGATKHQFFPFHWNIFDQLGIKRESIRILRNPTQFEELWIPELIWPINRPAGAVLHQTYSAIRKHNSNPSLKIFLSRRSHPRLENTSEVDALFQKFGFEVIFPEEVPFDKQLALYSSSKVLAGFAGSALHNVVFCNPGISTIEISDSRTPRGYVPMQHYANLLSKVNAHRIDHIGKDGTTNLSFLESNLSEILRSIDYSDGLMPTERHTDAG